MLRTLSYLAAVFPHVSTCGYNYAACAAGSYFALQRWAQEFLEDVEVTDSINASVSVDEVGSSRSENLFEAVAAD